MRVPLGGGGRAVRRGDSGAPRLLRLDGAAPEHLLDRGGVDEARGVGEAKDGDEARGLAQDGRDAMEPGWEQGT